MLFASAADNLFPGPDGPAFDIFTRNIQLNETELWTKGWTPSDNVGGGSISADGRYVLLGSRADNLVPGDTSIGDIYLSDLQTRIIERVSVNTAGEPGNDHSGGAIQKLIWKLIYLTRPSIWIVAKQTLRFV